MTLRVRSVLPFLLASSTIAAAAGFDAALLDDFEGFPYLWTASPNVTLSNPAIPAGDPLALPGQGAFERVLSVSAPVRVRIQIQGRICNNGNGVVPVVLLSTPAFDAITADVKTITLGAAHETHVDKKTGEPQRHLEDVDHDGDTDLVLHFRSNETGLACEPAVVPFNGRTADGRAFTAGGASARFGRPFAASEDWSTAEGLSLWYYGRNTGDAVGVELLDNRAPDPGPSGWKLAWSDEFNGPRPHAPGVPPIGRSEIGDGAANGIPGWGNDELESYTDGSERRHRWPRDTWRLRRDAADGSSAMLLRPLQVHIGPADLELERLSSPMAGSRHVSASRVARACGPPSGASEPISIEVSWPQSGEIDFMEYIGRRAEQVFRLDGWPWLCRRPEPLKAPRPRHARRSKPSTPSRSNGSRTDRLVRGRDPLPQRDARERGAEGVGVQPSLLREPEPRHRRLPGRAVGASTVFPQSMLVDYVALIRLRIRRSQSSFSDDFLGWREVSLPFSGFTRSPASEQPGAPDDGLGLQVGPGLRLPASRQRRHRGPAADRQGAAPAAHVRGGRQHERLRRLAAPRGAGGRERRIDRLRSEPARRHHHASPGRSGSPGRRSPSTARPPRASSSAAGDGTAC